jgi:lipoate-protein ligase B
LKIRDLVPDVLLLVEHPPAITMGSRADESMLRIPRRVLEQRGIPVINSERDGTIDFHAPGQLVGYIIRNVGINEVNFHSAKVEESVLKTLSDYGINARKGYSTDSKHKLLRGAWCMWRAKEQRLALVGTEIKQRVSMFGFTLNVNVRTDYFDVLSTAWEKNKGISSMQKVLERPIRMAEIREKFANNFANIFSYEIENKSYLSLRDAVNKIKSV